MKRVLRFKKRTWVLVGVIAVIAATASVGAYAYWTNTGSGSGTATAGAGNENNLTISATGWLGIAPGQVKPFTVKVTNPNTYVTHVNNVYLDTSMGGGTGVTTDDVGCLSSWFSVSPASINPNVDIAVSGDTGNLAYGNLTFLSPSLVNQNDCKSADITIHFTSD